MTTPQSLDHGWNTWDFRSYNHIVYLDRERFTFKLRISVYDPESDTHHTRFRWPQMPVRGPHAPDGSYWAYTFMIPTAHYAVAAAAHDTALDVTLTPQTMGDRCRLVVALQPCGEEPVRADGDVLCTRDWYITHPGLLRPEDAMFFISMDCPYLFNEPGAPCGLHLERKRTRVSLVTIGKSIAAAGTRYKQQELAGEAGLQRCLMAVPRAVTWNTVFDQRWTGVTTQISRDWGADWNGSYNFPWDQCFLGYLSTTVSAALARANFKAILASATDEGFPPNYYTSFGVKAFDRSQPPVGSYLAWKSYCITRDRSLLVETYAALQRWHAWWFTARDPRKTGLLSWGSNDTPEYQFPHLKVYNPTQQDAHICALYEAGMDNFPVMNELPFDAKSHTLAGHCVALNSLYTMDCEALAAIARTLGKPRDAARYAREAADMKARMRARLLDPETGMFCLRAWDGRWLRDWSAINFYPLTAGVATPAEAEHIVKKYLLDPELFWGDHVISVTALNYPASKNNDYWAGRIWPPVNFIVYEGLKRYRCDETAAAFALKSMRTFESGWVKANQICENYNMFSGEGGDVWNSDTGYGWGALLANFALQELIDVEPWSCALRIGTRSQQSWGVRRYCVGADTYRVHSAYDGLRVARNGALWLESTSPIVARFDAFGAAPLRVQINADRAGHLTLHGMKTGEIVRVLSDAGTTMVRAGRDKRVQIEYDVAP